MTGLACTICGRPSFARLRVEITAGAATYLLCTSIDCIDAAMSRAAANLVNAANQLLIAGPHPDAIDVDEGPMMSLAEIRAIEGVGP